jgi:hypothetical protein
VRVLAFLKRRPDVSRDAFRAHYEEVHVPTALPVVGRAVRHYVRHHLREELHGRAGFDCLTALEYADAAAMEALLAVLGGSEGEAIRCDELSFMDKPANRWVVVEPAPGAGGPAPEGDGPQLLVCVQAPAQADREAFRAVLAGEPLSSLRKALGPGRPWRPQLALAGSQGPPLFDAVVQIAGAEPGGLAAWVRELEATGACVLAARVSAHATPVGRQGRSPRWEA